MTNENKRDTLHNSPNEEGIDTLHNHLSQEGIDTLHKNTTSSNSSDIQNSTLHTVQPQRWQPHRWPCKTFNLTVMDNSSSIAIINNETVLMNIFSHMNKTEGCALVLFYSLYCEFSARLAPLYNALGRSYMDVAIIAVHVEDAMRLAARYGVIGIPTVFLFYSGRAVAKFNRSKTAEHFQDFVKERTGFEPNNPINITDVDYIGPLSSKVLESTDYYMVFSVCFLSLFILGHVLGSFIWLSFYRFTYYLKSLFNREKLD